MRVCHGQRKGLHESVPDECGTWARVDAACAGVELVQRLNGKIGSREQVPALCREISEAPSSRSQLLNKSTDRLSPSTYERS